MTAHEVRRPWWRGASREDRDAYKAARENLERVSKRDREETDAYFDAHDALVAAMAKLPWWQR